MGLKNGEARPELSTMMMFARTSGAIRCVVNNEIIQ